VKGRRSAGTQATPPGEEDRSRGHGAGFDAYLVKPIELDSLLAVLDSVRKSTRPH
jgi:DNA-binding response OmpR family regulator